MTALSEHKEQCALFHWAHLNEPRFPKLRLLYANANGGARHIVVARKLKAEGVKAGVPDVTLPVALGGYCGFYAELKRPKVLGHLRAGRVSASQLEWIAALREEGYFVRVAYGWLEAAAFLEEYLNLPPTIRKSNASHATRRIPDALNRARQAPRD